MAGAASAQTSLPETPFQRQIHRLDLSISGVGEFNTTVNGTVGPVAANTGLAVQQYGSNTLGALISIHYVARPYVGFQFNYGYARYTENYSGAGIVTATGTNVFQIQTKANELTLGYIAHPPHPIFGLDPWVGVGAGTTEFTPTPHGGEGAPKQARATYYYTLGLQKDISPHFALHLGFRELFFLDPDYGQNYLTILKHANTYEPTVGFSLHY